MHFAQFSLSDSLRGLGLASRRAPSIRRRQGTTPQPVSMSESEGGSVSWPFLPGECPRCRYYHPFDEPIHEGNAFHYEIVGLCLHPRIGMELFRRQLATEDNDSHCPCFSEKRAPRRD